MRPGFDNKAGLRRSSRTTEDSSSGRVMRLVPVFTLETNNECLPKFVQTHNVSSSIQTATMLMKLPVSTCPLRDLFLLLNYTTKCQSKINQYNTDQSALLIGKSPAIISIIMHGFSSQDP